MHKEIQLITAIKNNDLKSVQHLVKQPDIDISYDNNWALYLAHKFNFIDILSVLFYSKNVEDNIKKQDKEFYEKLTKIILKNKVKKF